MSTTTKWPALLRLYPNDPIGIYNIVRSGGYYNNNKFYPIKNFPNGFWDKETAIEITRHLILCEFKWGRDDICKNISRKIFPENRISMVLKLFNDKIYNLVSNCFPEMSIKPWELKCCPVYFWANPDNCKEVLLWVIDKEGYSDNIEYFCKNVTINVFRKYGVQKAIHDIGGLYQLINYTFPGRFKPWELKKLYRIDDELVVLAIKWMIEEKLKWDYNDVCNKISAKIFQQYGLGSILQHGCQNSPFIALEKAYPGVYLKDKLKKGQNCSFKTHEG